MCVNKRRKSVLSDITFPSFDTGTYYFKMGNKLNIPGLTEDLMNDYITLTYLTKSEIL